VATFCKEFEQIYNFETDKAQLSAPELSAFGDLFSTVATYSPFSLERATIPIYRSAEQIGAAVRVAQAKLGL